jgi:acyl-CoA reductase-like NAD-dependent aldehyde dehydrogenase
MPTLDIHNPATGQRITSLDADDAASVAAKAAAARAAQPAWAALPMAERVATIQRFRAALVDEIETLAATMTAETGKPIALSRNELNGLLPRIDFFVEEAEGAVRDEHVFDGGGMHEQIGHIPLGVVLNISAWNYPYFVGCNVIVPALLTGNAVLYKPSEYATLTGQHITRLLHEGRRAGRRDAVPGGRRRGRRGGAGAAHRRCLLHRQPRHRREDRAGGGAPHGQAAAGAGRQGPDVRACRRRREGAAESLADGAMYNTGQGCCSVERIYVHEAVHDAFVEHFVATVRGMKRGDPMDPAATSAPSRARRSCRCCRRRWPTRWPRARTLRHRRPGAARPRQLVRAHGADEREPRHGGHARGELRPHRRHPEGGLRRRGRGADERHPLRPDRRRLHPKDEAKARELLARVNAGSVYWNCCDRVSPRLPWSGQGDSGVGLTLSRHGIQTFTRPKAWHLRSLDPMTAGSPIFDLDHTLLDGDSDVLWCEFLMDEGLLDRAQFARRNARDGARLPRRHRRRAGLLRLLRGHAGRAQRRPTGSRCASASCTSGCCRGCAPARTALVQRHLDAGDLLLLSTATNRFLSELTARRWASST